MRFNVPEEAIGQRLDKFLTEAIPEVTRSQVKKLILNNEVQVNGDDTSVHYFLKKDDVVTIEKKAVKITPEKPKLKKIKSSAPAPTIIFENNDYIIINKPTGVLVHPTEKNETDTLANWIIRHNKKIAKIGNPNRPGIVHRLDKDVSGVMVIAKTAEMYEHLKSQFKERTVTKKYTALVYGNTAQDSGEITLPIGRSKNSGQFVAHPRKDGEKFTDNDKIAHTTYQTLRHIKDFTLLDVQIKTGRTHQIRAHFFAIGHPIIGDPIYKPKKKFFSFLQRKIKVVDTPRIFLHATTLAFDSLDGTRLTYTSALPDSMAQYITELEPKVHAPVIVISGPSGAGEDSVIEGIQQDIECNRVKTTVTRNMRPNESEGNPYYFISVEQFKHMIEHDAFIEWAIVYGDYRGATRHEIQRLQLLGKPILWKVDWQGVKTIKEKLPEAVTILIDVPSVEVLEDRLKKRGSDQAETIKKRSEFSKEWLKHKDVYDHIVLNEDGKLDNTIKKVLEIIKKNASI